MILTVAGKTRTVGLTQMIRAPKRPRLPRDSAPLTPPRNPSGYPQNEGPGGILSRALRSAAGAMGLQ